MMDIELESVSNPENRIKVLRNHWENVLKPQGQWRPVVDEKSDSNTITNSTKGADSNAEIQIKPEEPKEERKPLEIKIPKKKGRKSSAKT